MTKTEYDALTPYQQGYATYMLAERPNSEIPKRCPYGKETKEFHQWRAGAMQGVLEAQDSDD